MRNLPRFFSILMVFSLKRMESFGISLFSSFGISDVHNRSLMASESFGIGRLTLR